MLLIGCLLSLFVDRAKWTRLTRAVALVPCKKVGFLCIHLSLGWAVITAVRSTRLRRVSHWLNGRNIENCSPVFTCVRDGRKGAGERPPLDNWRATTATGRWPAAMVEKVVIHHGSSSRRSTRVMACVPHFEPMGERLVGGPLTHSSWPLFSSTCCSSWASSLPPWAAFWWNQGRPTEWPTAFLVCVSSVCVCVCVWHWQSLSDRPPVRKCPSLGQLRRACWCWLPVCWLVGFLIVHSARSGFRPVRTFAICRLRAVALSGQRWRCLELWLPCLVMSCLPVECFDHASAAFGWHALGETSSTSKFWFHSKSVSLRSDFHSNRQLLDRPVARPLVCSCWLVWNWHNTFLTSNGLIRENVDKRWRWPVSGRETMEQHLLLQPQGRWPAAFHFFSYAPRP